jgi:hypothetical protein
VKEGRPLRRAASSNLLQWANILNRLALLCKYPVVPQFVLMQLGPVKHKAKGAAGYCPVMNGTSMAAPHVSGVAALLMAAHPNAPANSICEVLKETASHPDGLELRPDNRWGHGVINPEAALAALSS